MIFNRPTDRSREGVDAAFKEARMLGHDSLGDEDLLLGILRADGGTGAEALRSLGVTLEGAREESEEMLSDALASIGISLEEVRREAGDTFDMGIPSGRKIPHSPRAKNALVEARREMRRLGDDHLGTEHVLLGILANADGTAVRMLARLGVPPGALEDRLYELRGRAAG
ncbi:MAG: peptidase [Actinomycetota bacterium]|nr:peptidase [Actinomycetota bacterium]